MASGRQPSDLRRVLVGRPDYLLTGHSHAASDLLYEGVRRINPGALHRAEAYTVAVLDVPTGELRWLPADG